MGARTGREYIEGLRDNRRVYVRGELIRDVTQYPPFRGVIRTLADLYDRQHDPTYRDVLTTPSPTSGQPVTTSFVLAKTAEEIEQRVRGERACCELTYGLMGRLPDFMNAFVTDMAAIRGLLGRRRAEFGGRQFQYEWFFAGDPVNNRLVYWMTERRQECMALARRLLLPEQAA